MHLCETKKHTFFTQKGVTNTIVRQTNKTLEKATQKVKAEVITRRRAVMYSPFLTHPKINHRKGSVKSDSNLALK